MIASAFDQLLRLSIFALTAERIGLITVSMTNSAQLLNAALQNLLLGELGLLLLGANR
jgi:hypothetical protein